MQSIRVRAGVVVLGASLAAPSLGAHHSFPAFYFEDQSTTVEGSVVEFEYRAPHAWVRVTAPDPEDACAAMAPSGRIPHVWRATASPGIR
jgi:hypothetical protein